MFAYVRFVDDNMKEIKPTTDIKDFSPKHKCDFDPQKVYRVLWSGTTVDSEGKKQLTSCYYKAHILKLGETKELLQEEIAKKRVTCRKNKDELSYESSNSDNNELSPRKKIKITKNKQKSSKADSERKIMDSFLKKRRIQFETYDKKDKTEDHQTTALQQEVDKLKKKLKQKEKECEDLRKLNVEYQKMFFEGGFAPFTKVALPESKEQEAGPAVLMNVSSPKPASLSRAIEQVEEAGSDIERIDSIIEASSSKAVPEAGEQLKEAVAEISHDQPPSPNDSSHEVHFEHGVVIERSVWELLKSSKNPSMLTKGMAVAIWGSDNLATRSTKGMVCNRLKKGDPEKKAKEKLTPEKIEVIRGALATWMREKKFSEEEVISNVKSVSKRISEKICDLNKRKLFH